MPFALHARGFRKLRIQQHRNHRGIRKEFVQQAEPFASDQVTEPAYSGDIAARPVEPRNVALLDRVAAGVNTIGMVLVAAIAAAIEAPPPVAAITAALWPIRSAT